MEGNQRLKKIGLYTLRSLGTVLCVLLAFVLIVNVTLLVKSYLNPDQVPDFLGYTPLVVQSGSMEPTIAIGDLVLTRKSDLSQVKAGDILSFYDNGQVVTHRIDKIELSGDKVSYITKGDNNNTPDLLPVTPAQVAGVYVTHVKGIGDFILFLSSVPGMLLFILLPISGYVLLDILFRRKSERNKDNQIQKLEQELAQAQSSEKEETVQS